VYIAYLCKKFPFSSHLKHTYYFKIKKVIDYFKPVEINVYYIGTKFATINPLRIVFFNFKNFFYANKSFYLNNKNFYVPYFEYKSYSGKNFSYIPALVPADNLYITKPARFATKVKINSNNLMFPESSNLLEMPRYAVKKYKRLNYADVLKKILYYNLSLMQNTSDKQKLHVLKIKNFL